MRFLKLILIMLTVRCLNGAIHYPPAQRRASFELPKEIHCKKWKFYDSFKLPEKPGGYSHLSFAGDRYLVCASKDQLAVCDTDKKQDELTRRICLAPMRDPISTVSCTRIPFNGTYDIITALKEGEGGRRYIIVCRLNPKTGGMIPLKVVDIDTSPLLYGAISKVIFSQNETEAMVNDNGIGHLFWRNRKSGFFEKQDVSIKNIAAAAFTKYGVTIYQRLAATIFSPRQSPMHALLEEFWLSKDFGSALSEEIAGIINCYCSNKIESDAIQYEELSYASKVEMSPCGTMCTGFDYSSHCEAGTTILYSTLRQQKIPLDHPAVPSGCFNYSSRCDAGMTILSSNHPDQPSDNWWFRNVLSLAYTHDGQYIAGGYSNGSIVIWRSADGAILHTLSQTKPSLSNAIELIAFSSDDTLAAYTKSSSVAIFKPQNCLFISNDWLPRG